MIYFDNAATTKPCKAATEAFLQAARLDFGNASSAHDFGVRSEALAVNTKKIIEGHLPGGEFIFTSGATESNNLAIFGTARSGGRTLKRIITTETEHPSVREPLTELEKEGFEVIRIVPGSNTEEKIIEAADENTLMVSFIAVNNETGFIIDTKKVYEGIKEKYPGCIVHVDGVQGFLKLKLTGDLISISGHKIHAPKGIGGLYIRKGVRLAPIIHGGGQQNSLRSGTLPTELISALGAAVLDYKYDINHYELLKNELLQLLGTLEGVIINSTNHLPNIINFSLPNIKSEVMLHFLAERKIYLSAGSACSGGRVSPVLTAFGVSRENAAAALRVSFSGENTKDEVNAFFSELTGILNRLTRNRLK